MGGIDIGPLLAKLDMIEARPATAGWYPDPLGRTVVRRNQVDATRWSHRS